MIFSVTWFYGLIYLSLLFMLMKFRKHFLYILLVLELVILMNLMFILWMYNFGALGIQFFYFYMIISACESVIGLSILVLNIRMWGNERMLK